ncbi:alpha-ketoglutarate-dependent dioxygenase FTO [Discoglossus pictus]
MRRRAEEEGEKEAKKHKLLEQIGGECLPYLTPKDGDFYQLWRSKYSKLILKEASDVPSELHQEVQKAFSTLLNQGCLFQDLVRLKGKDLLTPVSRILIGQPGCTYKYLNTRLFAVPWSDWEHNVTHGADNLAKSCKAFSKLNMFLSTQTAHELQQFIQTHVQSEETCNIAEHGDPKVDCVNENTSRHMEQGSIEPYSVTLINYMDPQNMSYLRKEPYFGMGKMAVSWHHDENLMEDSTVAVYSYSYQDKNTEESNEGRDSSMWHVGLKIAWDIQTPGLAVPLNTGDCYFMLGDMNRTHQHCVLAGSQPRFSSTHRVVECSSGTLQYIQSRCLMALDNGSIHPQTGMVTLKSLEPEVLKRMEETHNEVEFEWLRQYWFQGHRYTKCSDFWEQAMTELEGHWRQLEVMTKLLLEEIMKENAMEEKRLEMIQRILPLLVERRDLRLEWRARCRSKLAKSLPRDQAPRCYPYWTDEDPSLTLPFDLSTIVSELEDLAQRGTERPAALILG